MTADGARNRCQEENEDTENVQNDQYSQKMPQKGK